MSSDRQRLVGAIRRIANIDQDAGASAADSSNRGSQPGSIGYGVTESSDRLCCDGSVSGNTNPGTNTRDPADDTNDGLDPDDPADIGGGLTGVTDCDTGEPICFDGSGWIPPDGWSDPSSPPLLDLYQQGYIWYAGQPGPSADWEYTPEAHCAWPPCCFEVKNTDGEGTPTSYDMFDTAPGNEEPCWRGAGELFRGDCDSHGNDGCDPDQCDISDCSWPEDSCVNLAIIGGRIVGSKYDPENDGSYNAPRDEIELCDAAGNSILLRGSGQFGGNYKTIKSLSGDIDPDTDHGYLWSAYGDMIRQISPSEFRDDRV